VEKTATDVAKTVGDTRPLLQTVNTVATQDVPNSIAAVQDAMPNIVEVAGVMDTTLTSLSKFSNNQTIPVPIPSLGFGLKPLELEIPFSFDLGIDYKPTVPFDAAIEQVGASLDGLPDRLRTLEKDLLVADANMALISDDILNVSDDLATINQRIAEISPLLDEYIRIVNQVKDALGGVRTQVSTQLDMAKLVVLLIMVWIGLGNLAPLYLGLELVTGRRDPKDGDMSEAMADKLEALEEKIEAVEAEVDNDNEA
jgi:archaellum component FlaC